MLNLIKLTFALVALLGLIFIGGGIGHNSVDMILCGGGYTTISIFVLSLINYAQA